MEVSLCIYEVKQIQKADVLLITIPCEHKQKQSRMVSETKWLL